MVFRFLGLWLFLSNRAPLWFPESCSTFSASSFQGRLLTRGNINGFATLMSSVALSPSLSSACLSLSVSLPSPFFLPYHFSLIFSLFIFSLLSLSLPCALFLLLFQLNLKFQSFYFFPLPFSLCSVFQLLFILCANHPRDRDRSLFLPHHFIHLTSIFLSCSTQLLYFPLSITDGTYTPYLEFKQLTWAHRGS
jgi:hypothetical protein